MAKKVQSRDEFKLVEGMRVLIEVPAPTTDEGNETEMMSLGSSVEEVLENDQLLIQMPMYKHSYYQLPRDRKFKVMLFTESRMFAMDMEYINSMKIDGLDYAKVRKAGQMTAAQRRESYRLEVILPISILRRVVNEDGEEEMVAVEKSQLVNLSDGGLMFATDDFFDAGEVIVATIDIGITGEPQEETVEAEAIRTIPTHGVGVYKYRVTAKFNHKCRRQKDRFYKHIVHQQREKLRLQSGMSGLK